VGVLGAKSIPRLASGPLLPPGTGIQIQRSNPTSTLIEMSADDRDATSAVAVYRARQARRSWPSGYLKVVRGADAQLI
jgi:hypothetical protein